MIAHIDMDAFFARCEELRNPQLEEKPVVICVYTRGKTSGAVSTSNYKARELGIGSGMPLSEARQRANSETVFLPVDHDYYREKSEEVMSVVHSFSREVQQTSIDEAYFRLEKDEEEKARKIKARIESLGLTASIGIAPNKFLAKMASEEDKPDGLEIVREDEIDDFMEGRNVDALHGVGDKTADRLEEWDVKTVEGLQEVDNSRLVEEFGRSKTASLKARVRGEGSTSLESEEQKQISKIKTMERDSKDPEYIVRELESAVEMLYSRIENEKKAFRKVTLIGIDTHLDNYTRSTSVKTSDSKHELQENAEKLLQRLVREERPEIRRIGIRVSDLVDRQSQTDLQSFGD